MIRFIKIFLAIVFILFAALQYNDPDPFLWIFIYGLTALLLLLTPTLFAPLRKVALISLLVGLIYACFYLPGVYQWLTSGDLGAIAGSMKVDKQYVEETREFFGLLIAILALFYHHKTLAKK